MRPDELVSSTSIASNASYASLDARPTENPHAWITIVNSARRIKMIKRFCAGRFGRSRLAVSSFFVALFLVTVVGFLAHPLPTN